MVKGAPAPHLWSNVAWMEPLPSPGSPLLPVPEATLLQPLGPTPRGPGIPGALSLPEGTLPPTETTCKCPAVVSAFLDADLEHSWNVPSRSHNVLA